MATISFTGAAKLVTQITTITPGGTIAATDTFSVICNGKTLTFTATTTTVAHVITGLYDLIQAANDPEWGEFTASDDTTTLTLTGTTPGKPFTVTTAINNVSGGAAPTLTAATPTAASGPSFANVAANYSGAATPTTGDTLFIEGGAQILYGLDLSAVTLARLVIRDFSGRIGLPPVNADGEPYPEYREQYLKVSATVLDILQNVTSNMIRINVGSAATTATVLSSGRSNLDTIKAVTLLGSDSTNIVNAVGGQVGVATEAGETAKIGTLRVGGSVTPPEVECGEGVTLDEFALLGGSLTLNCDFADGTANGGTLNMIDDPDVSGTLTVRNGAPCVINGGPTIAKLVLSNGGVLDLSQDVRAVTFTNVDLYRGAKVIDPNGRAVYSNAVSLKECDLIDLDWQVGYGRSVTIA